MVFSIPVTDTNTRLKISATAVLTLIAFHFTLGFLLPKVSYLTRLDYFILTITFTVFIILGETLAVSALVRHSKEALAKRLDRFSRWGLFFFLAALVTWTLKG